MYFLIFSKTFMLSENEKLDIFQLCESRRYKKRQNLIVFNNTEDIFLYRKYWK